MLISLIITAAIVLLWIILAYISERFEIPSSFRNKIWAFIGMAGMCIIVWILIKWEFLNKIGSCCTGTGRMG